MKDRVFLDTNVILDLLGERDLFYISIAKIATLADKGKVKLFISALSYPAIFYVLSKYEDIDIIKEKLRKFKVIAITVDLTDSIIRKGLEDNFKDFEDSLQYHCALNSNCNVLITRSGKDFKEAEIPILTPDEYLRSLKFI